MKDKTIKVMIPNLLEKATVLALQLSVHKWEGVLSRGKADDGAADCPLCFVFQINACEGCPICAYTGKKGCVGSPYVNWFMHHREAHSTSGIRKIMCNVCQELALEELKFLRSISASFFRDRLCDAYTQEYLESSEQR